MSRIGVRELRNEVSEILARVERGEEFVVTVRGRPAARVIPLDKKPRTMPSDVLAAALSRVSADVGLLADLSSAVPDTTDQFDL